MVCCYHSMHAKCARDIYKYVKKDVMSSTNKNVVRNESIGDKNSSFVGMVEV